MSIESIENLRAAVQKHTENPIEQYIVTLGGEALSEEEIRSGVKKLYKDTGEYIDLVKEAIGEYYFEIANPNLIESDLPQPVIEFFNTQEEIMPEDITYELRANKNTKNDHELSLLTKRRGLAVSLFGYGCYDRPEGETDTVVAMHLAQEVMQPRSTVTAKKGLSEIFDTGDDLVNGSNMLVVSQALLEYARNAATHYINTLDNWDPSMESTK